MKKIYFLTFLGLMSMSSLKAQITITQSDFASADDTIFMSKSTQLTTVDVSSTGASQYWDYSYLVADTQRVDTFYNPSTASTTYQFAFNNSFTAADYASTYYTKMSTNSIPGAGTGMLPITIENPVRFTKVSSNSVKTTGIGLDINSTSMPVQFDTLDVVYQLPFTYLDQWDSTSYLELDLSALIGVIVKRNQVRSSIVDGYGTLVTPFGTFDAVRVKSEVTYYDSVYYDMGTGGQWYGVPTPADTEYEWWTSGNKRPVLKVISQAGIPTSIEYKDKPIITASISNQDLTQQWSVYPQPAIDVFSVNTQSTQGLISVFDLNGRILQTQMVQSNVTTLEVSALPKGVYVIEYQSELGVDTKKLIIQ